MIYIERINLEIILSTLFIFGFEKIDSILYTYILGKIFSDNPNLHLFEYEEAELSSNFNKYFEYDGVFYKFKDGISLDTNVSVLENHFWPLSRSINYSSVLLKYLDDVNLEEIVRRKIEKLCIDDINSPDAILCNKEKEIITSSKKNIKTSKKG